MSRENFVKFYEEHALKTPEIEDKLARAKDQPQFAQIAVAEGSKLGLSFTASEVAEVMVATEAKSGGALSDDQLSGVVGGAGAIAPVAIKAVPMSIGTAAPQKFNPGKVGSDWGGCW